MHDNEHFNWRTKAQRSRFLVDKRYENKYQDFVSLRLDFLPLGAMKTSTLIPYLYL
jgi:hypothetical protein